MTDIGFQIVTMHDDGSGTIEQWRATPEDAAAFRRQHGEPDWQSVASADGVGAVTRAGGPHILILGGEV